jgi:N-dimethylarginine dimethylaminohydrolase
MMIRLDDADFYHLDTCMSVLDERTVLIYPGAYDADGLSLVRALFEHVIEAPETEARGLFACNAHCPDRKHVIIQRGCNQTNAALTAAGFVPVEVDTDEFLKSGGSVFCMKQMFW